MTILALNIKLDTGLAKHGNKNRKKNMRHQDLLNSIQETLQNKSISSNSFSIGDKVVNVNNSCVHYGSKGRVCGIEKLPNETEEVVAYQTTNEGQNWKMGDILKKTANQLNINYDDHNKYNDYAEDKNMDEYKQSYYGMSVGSLRAIMTHAKDILDNLENPMVKENLTAPHLQGIIAVAENHLRSIHDFVMFVETDDDDDYEESESEINLEKKRKKVKISDLPHYEYKFKKYPGVTTTMGQSNRPGLWENIRKKKEKEGKKYRPAKPGDKDRPDPEAWKRLQK